jgi:phosphoglycolate phosphatase
MIVLPPPACVLFDLDGTLADTAPDLAHALNRTLRDYGHDSLPYERIRPVVSHGGIALTRLGFDMTPDAPGFEERRQHLLRVYADNLCRETRLFEGMHEVLAVLEQRGIAWGIVTNKPAWLTDPLIRLMQLEERAACVVSGDTCAQRKPHPEPLLFACGRVGADPRRSWYVGDAGRDMQAARAAGCVAIGALYGYLYPDDPPGDWDMDATIDRPDDLLALLGHAVAAG